MKKKKKENFSMRKSAVVILLAATVAFVSGALAQQPPERPIQTGVKTTAESYAVVTEQSVPMDQVATLRDNLPQALQKLGQDAQAAGYTLLGPVQVTISGVMPPSPDGKLTILIAMPVIEQPTEDELKAIEGLKVCRLEPTQVAYTFHKGGMMELQGSFMRLFQYTMGSGKEVIGAPTIIVADPAKAFGDTMVAELQLPVK
jgi:effector-binding domain-containing protein